MSSVKKKAIISACLLGEYCRYDGKTKEVNTVIEAFRDYEVIPFCPEAPLFGTPRERINVVRVNGEHRIITDETNVDVTQLLRDEIDSFYEQNSQVDTIILKSKSPSCGYKTTPIFNQKKEIVKYGDGIAASIFKKKFSNLDIFDETNFIQ